MTYTATYSSGDLSSIIVDIIGSGAVEVVGFIGIIILFAILGYLFAKLKKAGVLK